MFSVPKTSRRTKPFIDHILTFSILDNKVWFRNYQVRSASLSPSPPLRRRLPFPSQSTQQSHVSASNCFPLSSRRLILYLALFRLQIIEKDPLVPAGPPQTSLVEIGPRFVMTPIRIFEGSFSGATVFENAGPYLSLPFLYLSPFLVSVRPRTRLVPLSPHAHTPASSRFPLFRHRRVRHSRRSPSYDQARGWSQVPRQEDGREGSRFEEGGEEVGGAGVGCWKGLRLGPRGSLCISMVAVLLGAPLGLDGKRGNERTRRVGERVRVWPSLVDPSWHSSSFPFQRSTTNHLTAS